MMMMMMILAPRTARLADQIVDSSAAAGIYHASSSLNNSYFTFQSTRVDTGMVRVHAKRRSLDALV
jgi:hypothetical protein